MPSALFIALAWGLLALPGYALLRRFCPGYLRMGWLGTLSLSYLYTFALLTPWSIVCYLLHLPVSAFTVVIALLITVAILMIGQEGYWKTLTLSRSSFIEVAGSLLLLFSMYLSSRVGAITSGDGRFHIARVRMLLDHGFNNWDPSYFPHHFARVYHTNILHALVASISQLSQQNYLNAWVFSLPWAQLICASGLYYLSASIFRNRQIGWLCAILFIGSNAPIDFLLYPNTIASAWLLSLCVAFAIRYLQCSSRRRLVHLGIVCLVMPQVHSLYAFIAVIHIAPIFAAAIGWSWVKCRRRRLAMSYAMVCLLLPAPFLLASRYVDRSVASQADATRPASVPIKMDKTLLYFGDNVFTIDPSYVLNPKQLPFWLLPMLLLALLTRRRNSVFIAGAFVMVAMLILFLPGLLSGVVNILGSGGWIAKRFTIVHALLAQCFVVGAIFLLFRKRARFPTYGFMLCTLAFVLGVYLRESVHSTRWGWPRHVRVARSGERREYLRAFRDKQAFLKRTIPPGKTVLASEELAPYVVMLHSVYVLTTKHFSPGIAERSANKRDHNVLWRKRSTWKERLATLKKRRIDYIVLSKRNDRHIQKIYEPHAERRYSGAGLVVLQYAGPAKETLEIY